MTELQGETIIETMTLMSSDIQIIGYILSFAGIFIVGLAVSSIWNK